jgi:hypothetical protein
MKKLVLITLVAFFLCTSLAFAEVNWHTANQATIGWNEVTQLADGTPIPAGNEVRYVVYLANATTDPEKTNPAEIAQTTTLEQLITLNVEGNFYAGVKAERWFEGAKVGESVIAWSDDPLAVKDGQTFGLRYFLGLAPVTGIGPK